MVFIDDLSVPYRGRYWCHLASNNIIELHEFAKLNEIPGAWFHLGSRIPHYDIPTFIRPRLVRSGAVLLSARELIRNVTIIRSVRYEVTIKLAEQSSLF